MPIRFGKGVDTTTRYALITEIIIKEGVTNPKLNAVEYKTMPNDLKEAIPTNQLTYIKAEFVQCNAYLFLVNDIKDGKYNPGGIWNAFLVRRSKATPDAKRYSYFKEFKAFDNPKSYSKRQWDARVAINEQSRQLLSKKGRIVSRTEHYISPE